ncbi:MAG: CvpA family protein [Verrucomicrobiales bacterium]|nr:CvpA family protein [Verrucomicrobiales bacterium]
MTIWILALVLLAAAIALGHKLGAINAAFTFVGIVFGGLLATVAGKIFKPLLPHVGIHNPTVIWALAPILGFFLVLILFRMAGFFLHRKVEVYYKYNAGDLRLALWERMNARLGACIGALNGTAYIVLVSFLIFNFSYWSAQVAASDDESRVTKLVNRMGHDLENTGMAKPARALVTMPDNFYKMADLAGLICQNPQLTDRLSSYPAFISLAERDDLQQLTRNPDFTNAWNSHAPMGQLLNDPQVKTFLQNSELTEIVWTTAQNNFDDLTNYLNTGKSAKYDAETILGRWDFSVSTTVAMLRQAHPNYTATEMRAARAWMTQAYADTRFVAGSDGQAFLKNLPRIKPGTPPTTETTTWKGSWTAKDGNYNLTLASDGENKSMTAQTSGARLTLKDDKNTLIFDRAD